MLKRPDGVEHPISYASKSLNKAEQLYAPTEGELRAVMWAIRHFRGYLHGHQFIFQTDHKALTYLLTSKNLSTKLLRYALELQEYDFEIRHKPGIKHCNVDALSRLVKDESDLDASAPAEIYAFSATTKLAAAQHKGTNPMPADDDDDEGVETALHSVTKHRGGTRPCSTTTALQSSSRHRGGSSPSPSRKRPYKKTLLATPKKASPISENDEESMPTDDDYPLPPKKKFAPNREATYVPPLQHPSPQPPPPLPPASTLAVPSYLAKEGSLEPQHREPSEDAGPPNSPDIACELCDIDEAPKRMLICDGYQQGYNVDCLEPPIRDIPAGQWFVIYVMILSTARMQTQCTELWISLRMTLVLHYIVTEDHYNDDFSKQERQRIRRKAGNYLIDDVDGQLFCKPTAKYEAPDLFLRL